jgi:hypothetical protein
VLIDQPLNDLFINKEDLSKIAIWAIELSEHTIDFGKRSAIKSQVLADFVVDWTSLSNTARDEELKSGAMKHEGAKVPKLLLLLLHWQESS